MADPEADRQALVEVIHLGLVWHCLCAITAWRSPSAWPPGRSRWSSRPRHGRRPRRALAGAAAGRRPPHRDPRGRPGRPDRPGPAAVPRPSLIVVGRLRHRRDSRGRPRADQHAADRPGGHPQGPGHGLLGLSGHPSRSAGAVRPGDGPTGGGAVAGLCPGPGLAPSGTIADIAGGTGTLLAAVLRAAPAAHGVLVDQPQVLGRARPVLARQGLPLCAVSRGPVRPATPG